MDNVYVIYNTNLGPKIVYSLYLRLDVCPLRHVG